MKTGAKVLLDLTEKRKGGSEKKIQLEDFPIIKCVAGEKILCVQRQHLIKLIVPLVLRIIVVFSILFSLVFISVLNNSTLIVYIILTILSTFFVIEIFSFMT